MRYWAAARDAAGRAQESVQPAPGTLGELCAELARRHGSGFAAVLARSALLVDGERLGPREVGAAADRPLPADAVVEVLPPFAGG